jgi:hypothetical protein
MNLFWRYAFPTISFPLTVLYFLAVWLSGFSTRRLDPTTGAPTNDDVFFSFIFFFPYWWCNSTGTELVTTKRDELAATYRQSGARGVIVYVVNHAVRVVIQSFFAHSQFFLTTIFVWVVTYKL